MNLPALGACFILLLVCIVALIVQHEERQRRRLDRYRPTYDNRYPHRDEFRVMKDCK